MFFWIVRSLMKVERYKKRVMLTMFVVFSVSANSWKESLVVGCRSSKYTMFCDSFPSELFGMAVSKQKFDKTNQQHTVIETIDHVSINN